MHTPPVQTSPALQQGTVSEQLCVVAAHTAASEHDPCVAPGGTSQARPAQQSPFTVQLWPEIMQELPVPPGAV